MRDAIRSRLKEAAFSYLARHSASMTRLRQVLARRLARWRETACLPAADRSALVEEVVREMVALDLVNDRRFARERARALLRRGLGPPAIRHRLVALGISPADAEAAVGDVLGGEDAGTQEAVLLQAALAYARRRRLGPFAGAGDRRKRPDPRERARALAAFQRRGLPVDLARIILEAPDEPALVAALTEHGLAPADPEEG
ncbi:MAG: regulatory protein RecX [Alphaproteobacteria bacterium]|nr:MAG: regulatory protein RecX [Alphaproteobacteria bacterium]